MSDKDIVAGAEILYNAHQSLTKSPRRWSNEESDWRIYFIRLANQALKYNAECIAKYPAALLQQATALYLSQHTDKLINHGFAYVPWEYVEPTLKLFYLEQILEQDFNGDRQFWKKIDNSAEWCILSSSE